MNPDEEIHLLDQQLDILLTDHPQTWGVLLISRTAFRACTMAIWNAHGWHPTEDEVRAILNGTDQQRTVALLSLLKAHYIHRIEFAPGINVIRVTPEPDVRDEV